MVWLALWLRGGRGKTTNQDLRLKIVGADFVSARDHLCPQQPCRRAHGIGTEISMKAIA